MTTKELYDAIICKPDLHTRPELCDNVLVWHLYKNADIHAFCQDGDATIDIIGNSIFSNSLMHWHPEEEDMVEELYALGKTGNMLVLKKSLLGTSIFYSGSSKNYPLPDKRGLHFGKKKWDGGQLIYLEQK